MWATPDRRAAAATLAPNPGAAATPRRHLPQTRISQILAGKRSITPATALRLSKALGLSERYWLNAQDRYDIERERDQHGEEIDQVEVLAAAS
ncbi:MAG: HigA family addiction module antidote protein [Bifidobacteriaceae bacterium]|nr:HigA family addiction module antidote protein [Bifidobacteriaceae bacterium]